jgi:uncharacterized protein
MSLLVLAIGLALVVEGLALALAPRRMEDALRALAALSQDKRRAIGLGALALGVFLVWLARTA